MICKICGKEIPDDSNVCQFCGVNVRENAEVAQPVKESTPVNNEDEHVSMGQWLGIMAISFIPCVGSLIYLVMLFIWGFGDTKKKSLKTYAKASLIMTAISAVLVTIFFVVFVIVTGGMIAVLEDNPSFYY